MLGVVFIGSICITAIRVKVMVQLGPVFLLKVHWVEADRNAENLSPVGSAPSCVTGRHVAPDWLCGHRSVT